MKLATQREVLPNDIESLIRRLGQELSCSICLSVFDDPTMTPCNHTFCRECIERAVTLTRKSSTVPLNQCPICKSKTPKRSLNPSAEAAKLCSIYEDIVRTYSEINGGNEDWIHEAGIRGNDVYYIGGGGAGGVPLDNLSQLYPYPEKPTKIVAASSLNNDCDSQSSDLFTDLEEQVDELDEGTSKIYDETTQPKYSPPSSPLIYSEETQLTCDRLIINTQELEKLAAINDSIDKELAELEKKLAEKIDVVVENNEGALVEDNEGVNVKIKEGSLVEDNKGVNVKDNEGVVAEDTKENKDQQMKSTVKAALKVKVKTKEKAKEEAKEEPQTKKSKITLESKVSLESDEVFSPKALKELKVKVNKPEVIPKTVILKGLTTTGIKDEKSLLQLTKFSDKFNCPILPDFKSEATEVTHLLVPTTTRGTGFILKKRTMKYFEALLLKKEIISFDWIESCLKAGKLLSPSTFNIKGDEIGLKQGKATDSDYTKIFSSHKFYLYGEFSQPPRDQLEHLIKSSTANLLGNVHELSRGSIVLVDPTSQFTFEKDAEIIKKYPIVSPAWFLDSISCGRALDFHGYLIL